MQNKTNQKQLRKTTGIATESATMPLDNETKLALALLRKKEAA